MTTYHVAKTGNNSNNGLTLGTAFRNIQFAHNQTNSGDTIIVHPGQYNEQLNITTPNLIIRGSSPANRPIIWFAEYGNYGRVVRIKVACKFENFEVRGAIKAFNSYQFNTWGIEVGGTSAARNFGHITLRNCLVHHLGGAGIVSHYQVGLLVEECEVHTVTLVNYNGAFAGVHGWWPGGNSFTRGSNYVIRNNHIWDVWGEGLPFGFGVEGLEVVGNIVGRSWSGKIYVGEVHNAQIHRNLVFAPINNAAFARGPNDGLGLTDEAYTENVTDIDNVHFYNNIAVDCASGIWLAHGFDEFNTKNVFFYNNTVIALRAEHAAFRMYGTSYNNVNVTNNIFYVASSAKATDGNLSANVNFDRNLWSVAPNAIVSSVNDIIANPKLFNPEAIISGSDLNDINPQNYKLTATSPAINMSDSDITSDYFGNNRSNTPDLGAHEFDNTVPSPIEVNFSIEAGEEAGNQPHTVNFNSAGSSAQAGIATFLWDFGDGNQSTEANPTHVFITEGQYTVSLTITDTQGNSETKTEANYIDVLPNSPFDISFTIGADEAEGTEPHTVHFDSSGTSAELGIAAYLWDFGDGTQSTEANPTHTYTEIGFKTVTLTVTDNQDNSDSLTKENYIFVQSETGLDIPVAFYQFEEGEGDIVRDLAVGSNPLDLTIQDMSAVEWLDRGLKINTPTVLKTLIPAQKIISACQTTNAISIEAWVKPENLTQNGPARIVSISDDIYNRNVTLGQGGPGNTAPSAFYMVRVRTTDTNENGQPDIPTPPGSLKTKLQHVVYTKDASGQVKIYIDNQLVREASVSGDFNWDPSYALYLANERTGFRSWLGELHLVAIYAKAISAEHVAHNFELGPHAEITATFTIGEDEELGQSPHTVNFDASASSATYDIVSYKWDFGDGNTGEGNQVSHIYEQKGEYTPSLKIEDTQGNTDTKVLEYSIIVLEQHPERVVEGLQVLYTFLEGEGNTIKDVSPGDNPLALQIDDVTAVTWMSTGLRINQAVKITSQEPAKKVIDACIANNEITMEAWIKPARENQTGPARIVTLSKNLVERYATLAQGLWGSQPGNLYDIRLRRDPAKANGTPSLSTEAGIVNTELTHVVFTWDAVSGKGKVYLNGDLHRTKNMPGNLNSWDDGYYDLNLVNEATGGRNWLGDMFLVAIYAKALTVAEIEQNYQAGIVTKPETPENFRRFVLLHPHYNPSDDTTGLIAYGVQYPDMQCALIWEGDSEFDIQQNIDAVTEKYNHTTLHWLDE